MLRQRIRVSYGMGDTEVLPATDVKPLFPAGNQPRAPRAEGGSHGHASEVEAEAAEPDEAPDEFPVEQLPPTDDPSSDDHGPTDDPSSDDFQA